ncbi:hypothetical protein DOTSEDRAFT_72224 [Dothistroma septosporum NZE10]|uniref:Uncharacterized protein n=1 Tax=Dothistroma septosporum (strain NZE10 / CBS 128990) TaxID=675120 RepID=N1PP39_DOTSN|nr:hypothetical protein DOTSEDRAFT_72224 [Dothistroma septosporum NZE10]
MICPASTVYHSAFFSADAASITTAPSNFVALLHRRICSMPSAALQTDTPCRRQSARHSQPNKLHQPKSCHSHTGRPDFPPLVIDLEPSLLHLRLQRLLPCRCPPSRRRRAFCSIVHRIGL